MLLRGTELDRQREQFGLQEEIDSVEFHGLQDSGMSFGRALRVMKSIPHVVESASFSRKDWRHMSDISAILRDTQGNHPTSIVIPGPMFPLMD